MEAVLNETERRRKFFLFLPVFVVPFLAVFFYLFGGGKGAAAATAHSGPSKGFNTNLPGARIKDGKGLSKMSFYEQADRDSASLKEKLSNDPYFGRSASGSGAISTRSDGSVQSIQNNILRQHPELAGAIGQPAWPGSGAIKGRVDSNEAKVYEKIKQLNASLTSSVPAHDQAASYNNVGYPVGSNDVHNDVERLESALRTLKDSESVQGNPQMKEWSRMLDKIIAIQNPPSRDSIQRLSKKNSGRIYPVSSPAGAGNGISILQNSDTSGPALASVQDRHTDEWVGFYTLNEPNRQKGNEQNVITAAIDESQTLVSGADIHLRLTSDLMVNGAVVPAGTAITGIASLSGERLRIQISSIRCQNSIYSVHLAVYDVDGVAGIYIPGSINRDAGKESADQALSEMNMMSLDPSVGAQAATAGIQAAKTLISKKVRLVRVTVKDGYQVFLRDGDN